jgi:hypothetical protein
MLPKEIVPGDLGDEYQREDAKDNNDAFVRLQRIGLLDHSATVTRRSAQAM